jgi:hypothetical protein
MAVFTFLIRFKMLHSEQEMKQKSLIGNKIYKEYCAKVVARLITT